MRQLKQGRWQALILGRANLEPNEREKYRWYYQKGRMCQIDRRIENLHHIPRDLNWKIEEKGEDSRHSC
jgi:hypothetical protein